MIEQDSLAKLLSQPARIVAQELQARDLIDLATGKKVRLEKLQGFSEVGTRYEGMRNLEVGDLWAPFRRTLQTLIITRKETERGSCVRVLNSSYYDLEKGQYVYMNNEGGTATHLGMLRGGIAKLQIRDHTGALYLVKDYKETDDEDLVNKITPEEADRDLDKFFLP